jgi:hypothetical protein
MNRSKWIRIASEENLGYSKLSCLSEPYIEEETHLRRALVITSRFPISTEVL